jgi:gamma-glutamyl:cysteine ligase YbdK (ATP-grasp superfamily)
MAMSITLLEFVAMAAYTAALGTLAVALRKNGERAEDYRPACASERAALAACERAEAALAAAEAERRALLEAVAARELSGRAAEARKTLVAELAKSAYRTSLGAAIEAATANPTLERLNADLDWQLAERAALVAEPPTSKALS